MPSVSKTENDTQYHSKPFRRELADSKKRAEPKHLNVIDHDTQQDIFRSKRFLVPFKSDVLAWSSEQ